MPDFDELVARVNADEPGARNALFEAAYGELRKLARARLYAGGRNTYLDTTALVHETYLRFIRSGPLRSEDRRSFFAFASRVMRSVIVDMARERRAERRGAGLRPLTLNTSVAAEPTIGEDRILEIDHALQVLAEAEPRLAQVVEMRYFGGFSEVETADALGVTERTVRRDWTKARLLLKAIVED